MQVWSDGTVLVELPDEPETTGELDNIMRCVEDQGGCDVILDFSNVTILTSKSLAPLLLLRGLLNTYGRQLVLCCVDAATKGIFSVTALDAAFETVEDRAAALALVEPHADQSDSP